MNDEYINNGVRDAATAQSAISDKKKIVALLLNLFLGPLGIHRFYLGRVGSGITMLVMSILGWLTTGIFIGFIFLAVVGIWDIVDFFCIIFNSLPDVQGRKLTKSREMQTKRICTTGKDGNAKAIWNDVGKKATETTAGVVRKAQNMAGASKINNLMLEEERKRDNIYRKIGIMYASLQKDQKDPAFAPLMEDLEQSDDTIRAYEDQILSLKNSYRCTCGAVVSKDIFFCPACGKRVPRTASIPSNCPNCGQPDVKGNAYCPNCGKKIEVEKKRCCPICNEPITVGSRFCIRCGKELQEHCPSPAEVQCTSETQSTVVPPEQQPILPTPVRACSRCGAKIGDGNAFCTECGTAYAPSEKPSVPLEKVCPNCGAKTDPRNTFCSECGTKLPV